MSDTDKEVPTHTEVVDSPMRWYPKTRQLAKRESSS